MTNSMIPYSFIPGTKAKAGEVNANFIALADAVEQNQSSVSESIADINSDIDEINETLEEKADKTEIVTEHTVTDEDTDLNDYLTSGTYVFTSDVTPANIPEGDSGILIVRGENTSYIQQIWFCNDTLPLIYTRLYYYDESSWTSWTAHCGLVNKANPGYLKLANGLVIQWGYAKSSSVTYPLAYSKLAAPQFSKQGYGRDYQKSDTGFISQSLTGFSAGTAGVFTNMNWLAIGY